MPSTFERDARRLLGDLQTAYSQLLGDVGGFRRAVDIESSLRLDKKLAWRVHRVATARDPLESAPFAPTRAGASKVAQAASDLGIPEGRTSEVVERTLLLEGFVRESAPNRRAFDAMVASLAGEQDRSVAEAKRDAFEANEILYGRSSELSLFTFLAAPTRPGHLRAVSVRGHLGFQRLREDASLEVARHRFDVEGQAVGRPKALDGDAAEHCGAPVLGAFSSPDLPALTQSEDTGGCRRTVVAHPDLGLRSWVDCLLADESEIPLSKDALSSMCEIATPTRGLLLDFFVHEDLPLGDPEFCIASSRQHAGSWPVPPTGRLADSARVVPLGRGLGAIGYPSCPKYPELMGWVFEHTDQDPERFRVHRVLIELPLLHSVAWLRAPRTDA